MQRRQKLDGWPQFPTSFPFTKFLEKVKERIKEILKKAIPTDLSELERLLKEVKDVVGRGGRNSASSDAILKQVLVYSHYETRYIARCCTSNFRQRIKWKSIGPKNLNFDGSLIPGADVSYHPAGLELWKPGNFDRLVRDVTRKFANARIDIDRLRAEAERGIRKDIKKKLKCCKKIQSFKMGGLGLKKIVPLEF